MRRLSFLVFALSSGVCACNDPKTAQAVAAGLACLRDALSSRLAECPDAECRARVESQAAEVCAMDPDGCRDSAVVGGEVK